jgi:hypothetical protein
MLESHKRHRETLKANLANEGLIDRHAAAAILRKSIRTLQRMHRVGRGPKRVPRREHLEVLYRRSEVEQWKSRGAQTSAIGGQQTAEQQDVQIPAFSGHQTAEQQDVQIPAFSGHQTAEQDRMPAASNSY